jgi:hypothetical protein
MNPKHSNRSSLNVQEAHRPGCSALVALRPRSCLLHIGIELRAAVLLIWEDEIPRSGGIKDPAILMAK